MLRPEGPALQALTKNYLETIEEGLKHLLLRPEGPALQALTKNYLETIEEGLKHLLLRPEGPSCYSPGRSEAEAWVLSKRHRVLKGRHKHATFYSTMPIIVKNKAHFLHKMNP